MSKWVYLLWGLPQQVRATLRHALLKMFLALCGAIFVIGAGGFVVAALYVWLTTLMADYLAALCVAGALAVIGVVFFLIARARRRYGQAAFPNERIAFDSSPAPRKSALDAALSEIESSPSSVIMTAVAVGVIVGLLRPDRSR